MTKQKIPVAILGPGNIGTDLIYKIARNPNFELVLMAGIDPASEGLARARDLGVATSADGVRAVLEARPAIVFEATSAYAHKANAPLYKDAGIFAVDLTPAKMGPSIVPSVNMSTDFSAMNVNLISCAAQATIPLVHAVSRITPVSYAEIAAGLASHSVGPGTRQNVEEFAFTTQSAIAAIGGASKAKALVAINPAEPPQIMRNTVYTMVADDADDEAIKASIHAMVKQVQSYVPGYRLTMEPFRRGDHFMVGIEVEGAGDYLPKYAGNLDIINAAAIAVAEGYAATLN
ncbi:acetaldehyde dehydrogenase (acetylating) [Limnohabitans sp.]|jgi:acetaldehyde dehydrogenase|uniref:acetaldehyde dehydrogenase (acetylating) n=1 Tax=Limnohabitans sp. TaxID=1907725 RepID=UPI0026118B14|nr:acetaldehyde dehydrogenase (acetylating) [Limnohabitans sp.]